MLNFLKSKMTPSDVVETLLLVIISGEARQETLRQIERTGFIGDDEKYLAASELFYIRIFVTSFYTLKNVPSNHADLIVRHYVQYFQDWAEDRDISDDLNEGLKAYREAFDAREDGERPRRIGKTFADRFNAARYNDENSLDVIMFGTMQFVGYCKIVESFYSRIRVVDGEERFVEYIGETRSEPDP